jgi:hypothetical protein
MGLTKSQLEQLNNNSFPNNNSGYITPDILRTYNDAIIVNTVNQDVYLADSASFDYRLQNFNPANLVTTATFNAYTQSASASVGLLSASYVAFTASYYIDSASFNNRINTFNPTNLVNTASFNAYTASTNAQLANLEALTGSYLTTGSLTSNQYVSGNFVFTEVNTFVTQSTASNLNTHNGPTLEFLAGNISSTYPSLYDIVGFGSSVWSGLRVSGAGLSTPLITNMFISGANNVYVTVGAGNSVSASSYVISGPLPQNVDFKVNNLIVSGNIVTNQSVLTNTIGANSGNKVTVGAATASVNRLEANNISSSIVSASSVSSLNVNSVSASFNYITADSASITYLKVIYETSSVVFSSGSNILGDNANDDVQTLIGRTIVTGSLEVTGSTKINGDLSASTLNGIGNVTLFSQSAYNVNATQSYQIVANALTASNALTALSQSLWFTDTTQSVNLTNLSSSIFQTDATQSTNIATLTSKTGSYATTGSNTFKGDQTITGSVFVSGAVNIANFFQDQLGLVLTADKLSSNYYSYASDNANFNFGVFGTGYDNELYISADQTNGVVFGDWDNNLGNYNTWLQTVPNDGSNPSPIFPRGIAVTGSATFTQLTGSLAAYSASVSSRITFNSASLSTVSASLFAVSGAFVATSQSLNTVSSSYVATSGSLNAVSSSLNAVSSSYVATSGSLNTVSSSLNTVSASAYTVSGSYNSMSASAVSNVTDTYTSVGIVKYIVSLTQAEYAAIGTPNANTLYIVI